MPKSTDVRMVNHKKGAPVLEVIKERNTLLIGESNNMHRNVKLILSATPTLIDVLGTLLDEASTFVPSIEELCSNDIPSLSVMLKSASIADERFAHLSGTSNDCSSYKWRRDLASEVRSL